MNNKLRVGIVGVGIGRRHFQSFQQLPEQFEVIALCDLSEARARAVVRDSVPYILTDFDVLCGMETIDVIDICTPSHLHFTQTQQALLAGKHVICEKPHASSLAEIDILIRLKAESPRQVMPIFQYRFGHGIQKLKLLQARGLTGSAYLATVETAWRRRADYYAAPWRGKWETELGGALVTLAIHNHDLLCYVLGPVKRVFARTTTRVNPIETEDCISASLEMADGSLASLSVTTGSAQEISRLRFCFEGLTAESHTHPYRPSAEPWTFTGDSPEIEAQIQDVLAKFTPMPEGFVGQFYAFYQAVQNGILPPVTLADARVSLELITAIYHSAQTDQAVDLPIEQNHPTYHGWLLTAPHS
jgi:predicted dehydrogenase